MPESPREESVPAEDPPETISGAVRRGFYLWLYLACFVAFLALNVFWPRSMILTSLGEGGVYLGGLNFAVVLGLALIAAGMAMSLAFLSLARRPRG